MHHKLAVRGHGVEEPRRFVGIRRYERHPTLDASAYHVRPERSHRERPYTIAAFLKLHGLARFPERLRTAPVSRSSFAAGALRRKRDGSVIPDIGELSEALKGMSFSVFFCGL